ncbi:transketolase [Caerostris extrusa]|uniref:Transketolase n=1 Tax=Caerostris extrusa TaxID=172846 RepID=A0AAV4VFX2_CAEEX|nr:transketolase [Caerostris extrusa]
MLVTKLFLANRWRYEHLLNIENKEGWHGKPLGTQGTEIIKQIQEELLKKGMDTKLERTAPEEEIEAINFSDMKLSEEPSYVYTEKVATRLAYGTKR